MRNKELMEKARKVLNQNELKLFEIMNGQYLVPFIKGAPGIGKTATLESIANKLDMIYIDLRLPTVEETEMGLYPRPKTVEVNGSQVEKLTHLPPEWALMPLENPDKNYMFVFEELNRAPLAIRNAAMGVVLERRVGWNVRFSNNVFMAATGNLGSQDGTEVEELDFAQRDRFIIIEQKHDLHQWINDYAKDNVHPDIIKYLTHKPAQFYPDMKDQDDNAVITPRKWSGFSNFIVSNTEKGLSSKVDDYLALIDRSGAHFIGKRIAEFRTFVMEGRSLTVQDVLKGTRKADYTAKYKNGDPVINRDNMAEVLHELKGLNLTNLKKSQVENLMDFLKAMKTTDHDMLTGYLFDVFPQLDREISEKEKDKTKLAKEELLKIPVIDAFMSNFRAEFEYINDNNKHERKSQ